MSSSPRTFKNLSTSRKRGRKSTGQQTLSSITGVHPKRTHGFGLWNNERKPHTIRIDDKLFKTFKPVAIANYGSVCRPIEAFMASVISTHPTAEELRVHPSNTIEIGKLVIERNVRARRALVEETEVTETVTVCGHVDCKEVAVGSGVWRKKKEPIPLCADHYKEAEKLFWIWSHVQPLEVVSK